MRIIIFLVISFSLAAAMEPQQLSVEKLDRYTLVGNDGKEVVLDGALVREYLPGLADKFREGMIEARTGKIRVNDLDGQALANLKSLLERYIALEQDVNRQKEKLSQLAVEEYLNQEAVLNKRLEEQITFKLENLPKIGDHFIALYKELVFWGAPDVLARGMAEFAAQLLKLGQAYELFKNLDPQVQLLYLNVAVLSVDSLVKTLEWIVEIQNNPIAQGIENFDLMVKVRTKIIDFIVKNIQAILAKKPDFKNLFEKPEFKNMGQLLKKELTKNNSPIYSTTLRQAKLWGDPVPPSINELSNNLIALRDSTEIDNWYNFRTHTLCSSPLFKKMDTGTDSFIFWPPNRIIFLDSSHLTIYDLSSSQRIFQQYLYINMGDAFMTTEVLSIKVLPIKENVLWALLIPKKMTSVTPLKYELYSLTYQPEKKVLKQEKIQSNVLDILSLNGEKYVIVDMHNNTIRLSVYDAKSNKNIKTKIIQLASDKDKLNKIRKIDDNHIGLTSNQFSAAGQTLAIYYDIYRISDLEKVTSYNFKSTDDGFGYLFIPVSKHFVLKRFRTYHGQKADPVEIYDMRNQSHFALENLSSVTVLDENHFAAYDHLKNSYIIGFIPMTGSIIEIFDEILRYAPAFKKCGHPQKRPVSPVREIPIPAAAQGLRPEVPETKQPRIEKPNG